MGAAVQQARTRGATGRRTITTHPNHSTIPSRICYARTLYHTHKDSFMPAPSYPSSRLRLLGAITSHQARELAQVFADSHHHLTDEQQEPASTVDEALSALTQGHDTHRFATPIDQRSSLTSSAIAPMLWHTLESMRCPYAWIQRHWRGWSMDITDTTGTFFTIPLLDGQPDRSQWSTMQASDSAIHLRTQRWVAIATSPHPSFAIVDTAHQRLAYTTRIVQLGLEPPSSTSPTKGL